MRLAIVLLYLEHLLYHQVLGEVPMSKPVQALDSCHGGRLFATGGGEERLIISKLA